MNKSKYDPEIVAGFCAAFASGLSISQAAKRVGLTRQTVCSWVSAKPEFAARFTQARIARDLLQ